MARLTLARKIASITLIVWKKGARFDALRGLKTGIEYMLSRSTQLPRLEDAEAQYRVIRHYFDAVKKWQPKAWSLPKEYIMLRGSGLWAI